MQDENYNLMTIKKWLNKKQVRENHLTFRRFANKILLIANLFISFVKQLLQKILELYTQIEAVMKRLSQKRKTDAANFSFEEKLTIIYFDLYIAKDRIFKSIDQAFYEEKISSSAQKSWKKLFENEFTSCLQMQLKTYRDCAFLEFKVRHLANAVENLNFDREEPWQGFTISFENTFFSITGKH